MHSLASRKIQNRFPKILAFCTFTFLASLSASADRLPLSADDLVYERGLETIRSKPVTLSIDCGAIRYVGINCELDIRQQYFSKNPNIVREDRPDFATIQVKFWDEIVGNFTVLHTSWSSTDELSVVSFKKDLRFQNEDLFKKISIVQSLLTSGVLGHLRVIRSENGNGTVTVSYEAEATDETTGTKKKQAPYTGPFYVSFSVDGYSNKSGIGAKNENGTPTGENTSFSGNIRSALNYSTRKLRLKVDLDASQTASSVPDGLGGKIKSGSKTLSGSLLTVYSFGNADSLKPKRWNLVMIGSSSTEPASNIKTRNYAQTGMQYTLVPFRIDENRELRFQLGGVGSDLKLLSPNGRGKTQEKYFSAFSQLYLYWLFSGNKASVESSVNASKNLKYPGHYNFGTYLSFSYQLTDAISFHTSGNYNYAAKSLSYPGHPDYTNPTQTQYLGGNSGGDFFIEAGIRVTLLNSTLFTQDRRGN